MKKMCGRTMYLYTHEQKKNNHLTKKYYFIDLKIKNFIAPI